MEGETGWNVMIDSWDLTCSWLSPCVGGTSLPRLHSLERYCSDFLLHLWIVGGCGNVLCSFINSQWFIDKPYPVALWHTALTVLYIYFFSVQLAYSCRFLVLSPNLASLILWLLKLVYPHLTFSSNVAVSLFSGKWMIRVLLLVRGMMLQLLVRHKG